MVAMGGASERVEMRTGWLYPMSKSSPTRLVQPFDSLKHGIKREGLSSQEQDPNVSTSKLGGLESCE